MDNYSTTDSIWEQRVDMYEYMNWECLKVVAKRVLTKKQYIVVSMAMSRGMTQKDISIVIGITQQGVSDRLVRASKRLKKTMEKYRKNRKNNEEDLV